MKTNDCFFGQTSEAQDIHAIDMSKVNLATGPIYVEGAEQVIYKVEVLDIEVDSHVMHFTREGLLENRVAKPHNRVMPVKDGRVQFGDLLIPIKPMIGVIGLAPSHAEGEWPTDTPWKHGGNMDTTDIAKGSALFLRVSLSGAVLALGDCHALMAIEVESRDETAAEVTLRVDLTGCALAPIGTGDYTMVIVSETP